MSENLLLKVSSELNKQIEISNCDCSEFWSYFEKKDFSGYEKGIAKKIELLESKVDVVFLAQASMEGAKKYLKQMKKEVLSSPEFGINEPTNKEYKPKRLIFNKPFLVQFKRRDSKNPYLVAWISNTELMKLKE